MPAIHKNMNTTISNLTIRRLHKKDIPALACLAAKTYTETFGASMTTEELQAEIAANRSPEYFASVMEHDTVLLAFIDDELAGYIQMCDVRLAVEGCDVGQDDQAINAIYIDSRYQGKGIGKRLMDAAISHERLQAAPHIFIDVWDENKRAVNFYLSYGFEKVGTCPVVIDGQTVGHDLVLRLGHHISEAVK